MADIRLNELLVLINQQVKIQEKIEACLWKLEALISVAVMADDFYELSGATLHNYFSIASDLVEEATTANQMSMGQLLKQERDWRA